MGGEFFGGLLLQFIALVTLATAGVAFCSLVQHPWRQPVWLKVLLCALAAALIAAFVAAAIAGMILPELTPFTWALFVSMIVYMWKCAHRS